MGSEISVGEDMVFNSYIFILLFLPLAVIGYFLLNKYCYRKNGNAGLAWLLGVSLVFYAYDIPIFLLLFVGSILVNYILGRSLTYLKHQVEDNHKLQKTVLILGIVFNLAPLAYFKYGDFFVDSIEDFFHAEWNVEVALPLGISFFTFLQIAYIVDCYREEKGFDYTFLEYATYVAFFPKITMGPIVLHSEVIPTLRNEEKKQVDYNNLSCGFYMFALGLAKKVLLADTLAKFVSIGYKEVYWMNAMTTVVVMLCYTLQLYFDFSGYCDMAVGIAKMFNIDLPYNFNSPYKAKSISEFWDRWHMTLTRFFTRYVYIPLGGSRRGKLRTYANTIIVFLLSGLWHGADWTFVFWGLMHGILMTIEKIGKDIGLGFKRLSGIPRKALDGVKWLVTFVIINITWVFFRAESMEVAFIFFERIASGGWKCQEYITDIFNELIEIRILKRFGLEGLLNASVDASIWGMLILLILGVVFLKNTQEKMMSEKYNWIRSIFTVVLIVWCVISLSDVSEFLYFNF